MGHPALVLGAELARPVDATHADRGGRNAERRSVVQHILVRHALGTAIGRTEIQWSPLIDSCLADFLDRRNVAVLQRHHLDMAEIAIDLVGARKDDRRATTGAAHRLQHIERTAGIHLEVVDGIVKARRHGGLRRQVKDRLGIGKRRPDRLRIPNVGQERVQAVGIALLQPGKVLIHPGPAQIVQDDDVLAVGQQPFGKI